MRIHQHSTLDYNHNNQFLGVTELTIFDVNHGLAPGLGGQTK